MYFEKLVEKQLAMPVVFSPTFVADTKIVFNYKFVAPLKNLRNRALYVRGHYFLQYGFIEACIFNQFS